MERSVVNRSKPLSFKTRLVSPRALSRATGVRYQLILDLVESGEIPSVPLGNRRRIDERWALEWLSRGGASPRESGAGFIGQVALRLIDSMAVQEGADAR